MKKSFRLLIVFSLMVIGINPSIPKFSNMLPVEHTAITPSELTIHADHNDASPILGTISSGANIPIYAVWNSGNSCWAVVHSGDRLEWVDATQLPDKNRLCWELGKSTLPTPVCVSDDKNQDCFEP